jgi:hypothetical protein
MSQDTTAAAVAGTTTVSANDDAARAIQKAVRELFASSPDLRSQLVGAGFDRDPAGCRQWLEYSLTQREATGGSPIGDGEPSAKTVDFSELVPDEKIVEAVSGYLPWLIESLLKTYTMEEIRAHETVVIQEIVDFLNADIRAFINDLIAEASSDLPVEHNAQSAD